jgi:hypothetical protein
MPIEQIRYANRKPSPGFNKNLFMNKTSKLKESGTSNTADFMKAVEFRKKNKKRLLPDVFYLRWEVELLSALVAILVLMLLPDWLNDKVKLFLSGYDTSMNTNWITVACNILLAFFMLYIIFRIAWIFFIRKGDDITPGKIRLAMTTDHLAEIIFSLCIIF